MATAAQEAVEMEIAEELVPQVLQTQAAVAVVAPLAAQAVPALSS